MQNNNSGFDHVIGDAVMDKHYNLKIADESIYSYLGATAVPLFLAYIYPDDRKLLVNALEAVDNGEGERYVTVRLKSFVDKYCVVIIFIKQSSIDPKQFYELNIYDIVYLVKEYEDIRAQLKKLKLSMQLLKPAFLFDYNPKTDEITVFSDRDTVRFKGRLEELHSDLMKRGAVDKASLSGVNRLFTSLKSADESISCTLNMTTFSDGKEMQPVNIRTASVMDKENNSVLSIVGVLSPASDTSASMDPRYINSNLDPLTGLYNKAAIKDLAIEALNRDHKSVTYAMLDLDSFKEVNDTYGHMFGDEVILNVARIIKDAVGKNGYVGRVGGDEFFVVLLDMGTELNELRPIMRSIRAQVEWAYKGRLGGIRLTVSIGCASYGKDADNYEDLFKLADHCLYCAKSKGRDRFVVYDREKHGSLEDIKVNDDKAIKIERKVSQRQKLEFVVDAVNRLTDWRKAVIDSVLSLMLKYFLISEVTVYDVKSGKPVYSAPHKDGEGESVCDYLEDIKHTFRESNVFAYGDYFNLKMPFPDFFDYVEKNDYYSLYIYAIKDKGEITHLVAIYSKGHYEKWSETDQNYFSIICKTIGDKILNG